jgi:hypothetical protein
MGDFGNWDTGRAGAADGAHEQAARQGRWIRRKRGRDDIPGLQWGLGECQRKRNIEVMDEKLEKDVDERLF